MSRCEKLSQRCRVADGTSRPARQLVAGVRHHSGCPVELDDEVPGVRRGGVRVATQGIEVRAVVGHGHEVMNVVR